LGFYRLEQCGTLELPPQGSHRKENWKKEGEWVNFHLMKSPTTKKEGYRGKGKIAIKEKSGGF